MRVLIIEDEKKVADALNEGLRKEGFEIDVANTGEDGFFLIGANRFDVIVLDWMLPGRDGLEVLSFIRKLGLKTPVLFLTARDSIEDRTAGLNKGADDYLVKPFAFSELVARIRALLRRTNTETSLYLIVHDLEMDLIARKVARNGEQIVLTVREFQLLEYLVRHQNHIVTRDTLARDVWKEVSLVASLSNVIDVHIARLRKKIDQDYQKKLIHTVRGVGFVLGDSIP